MTFYKYFL